MLRKFFNFVFCCLSQEEKTRIEEAFDKQEYASICQAQSNLMKEKDGFRCNKCGRLYPFLQLEHQGEYLDLKSLAKNSGPIRKGKKAADIFQNHYYYAKNKKTLLKFEETQEGSFLPTDSIPVMTETYHFIQSQDERYIATETFNGTVEIIDVQTKQPIARKLKLTINGAFTLAEDGKVLYYFKDAIHCWDFLRNIDKVIWRIPEEWKSREVMKDQIHTVCNNIIYNEKERAYLFQCNAGAITYVVTIRDMAVAKIEPLAAVPTLCKLVYSKDRNQYTLSVQGGVVIYDDSFAVKERFAAPCFHVIHNGGGIFPIGYHKLEQPKRTVISPDGKWLLLDYFRYLILMENESKKIVFCLYSHTEKVVQHVGFTDKDHFWYTWGDTTYIQKIDTQ